MRGYIRDIEAFFTSRWTLGSLLILGLLGLLLSLAAPRLYPPVAAFGGEPYALGYWLTLGLSLALLSIRGLMNKTAQIRRRGLQAILWESLTSIPLAISLIALLVLIGLISTIVPQLAFNREIDLVARYGRENFAILKSLGFFTIFNSWYSYAIVGLFVLNLSACTVKRLRASGRYVRMRMRPKRPDAIRRMPITRELSPGDARSEFLKERIATALRTRGFRVVEEGGQLLAERWRWERFAIDVFHVSLLIAISALIVTNAFGYSALKVAHEGDVLPVAGREFRVRVDQFWSENYAGSERVMDWKTRLTILEDGKAVANGITEVNHPFTYGGVSFYQAAMGEDWLGATTATLRVTKADGTTIGEYQARVGERFTVPQEGIEVGLDAFLPDFALEDGVAYSKTQSLRNPAAYLKIYDEEDGKLLFRTWTFSQLPQMQNVVSHRFRFYLEGFKAPQFTGLEISRDPGLPVAYSAFGIMMIMLVANLLFKHQMVWVHLDERGKAILGGRSREGDFEETFEQLVRTIGEHVAGRAGSPAGAGHGSKGGRLRRWISAVRCFSF